MRNVMLSIALITLSTEASAQVLTVGDAVRACQGFGDLEGFSGDTHDAFDLGMCRGVAEGVRWLMRSNCGLYRAKQPVIESGQLGFGTPTISFADRADAPHDVGAALQAFRNWAEENPQDWGESFVWGMIQGLSEGMPCEAR
jgi:hypothetical protein